MHTTLHQLGRIRARQGRYAEAKQLLKESLRIKEERTLEIQGIAHTLCELGQVEWALGKNTKAQEHLQRSLTISQAIGDHIYVIRANLALGLFHESRGEKDISHKFYSDGVCAVQQGITPTELMAEAKFRLGSLCVRRGDFVRGLRLVAESVKALSRSELFLAIVIHRGLTAARRWSRR